MNPLRESHTADSPDSLIFFASDRESGAFYDRRDLLPVRCGKGKRVHLLLRKIAPRRRLAQTACIVTAQAQDDRLGSFPLLPGGSSPIFNLPG